MTLLLERPRWGGLLNLLRKG
jgi:6-phosphofructokinase 1